MITKQDLLAWFDNLASKVIKQSAFTMMLNGNNVDIRVDKQNASLVMDIIQKYNKELVEIPSHEQLSIFKEIVEQCASGKFKSINVATQKRRVAIIAVWKYLNLEVNF